MTTHLLRPLLVAVLLGVLSPSGSSGQATAAPPAATTTVTPPYKSSATWTANVDEPSCRHVSETSWWGYPYVRYCQPYAAADHDNGTLHASIYATGTTPAPCSLPYVYVTVDPLRVGGSWCHIDYGYSGKPAAKASITAELPRNGTATVELVVLERTRSDLWNPLLQVLVEQRGKTLATFNSSEYRVGELLVITARGASRGPITVSLLAYQSMPGGGHSRGTMLLKSISVS